VGTPMVINIWSTTCTVCVQETPAIESVVRAVGGRVHFVGIDSLDTVGAAKSFVKRFGVTYQQLFDRSGSVAHAYGIADLPVSFFVSASGKVVGANLGALTVAHLDSDLRRLFGVFVS
jgi:cytochrome c biogenesis protein CcmG/thiol:disulfide interchange protein DsbE